MSILEHIPDGVPDGVSETMAAFKGDGNKLKVNLSPGLYCDENAKPWVLPVVKEARHSLISDGTLNISPQTGDPGFVSAAREIMFGDALADKSITSIQTIAGTGANQFAARFLSDTLQPETVWLSDPTWENHTKIWMHVNPAIKQRYYPYFDYKTSTLDVEGMIFLLRAQASKGDVLILHACAHNPTGLDPSKDDWQRIAEVCEEKQLFPVFDCAYQGFASGNIDDDAWAIRHFITRSKGPIELAVAQSFSKNFGLYSERIGCLHIVTKSPNIAAKVDALLRTISRAQISSAPAFSAKVVAMIWETPELKRKWHGDLQTMNTRLRKMRARLHSELTKRKTPGDWDHFLTDIGMFSMTGFPLQKVKRLREEFHVYLMPTGRLSFTGLTEGNVEYVADCMHQVSLE
ncbi:aspartate aminotransferase-like protein [Xylaria bambusicola]|uniref:aspartate aminotransferase-like protein n=1 Tax=Xylaria bambusicola TaxID=326684 RepID=UPI002007AFE7|nr:aspartate aminotransferase-like protein [Xylaria bambusicola]KAI0521270.1 aspartate aminotransferase-like protein [Xylaria bambusicola]